jgi:arabinose-5-phosphate isomerase
MTCFPTTDPQNLSDHYSKVIDTIKLEAEALDRAAGNLSETDVNRAVELLKSSSGKVIVTGVGKSGVIAEKIAQTMTSSGTLGVFVDPSDAIHGGLAMFAQHDVVIALSNSGETDELIVILPYIKSRTAALIAITGNVDSTLARNADAVLNSRVEKEACPLNLAPTASTTVALAIGDALAMALMGANGLTEKDFAANHPAGQLGKRLTLTVSALMHPSPEISRSAGWLEVVRSISKHSLGAVNVIDDRSHLLGIITDGDLRRTIEKTSPDELSALNAEAMMTASPVSVSPDLLAYDALRLMEDRPSQISVLPVVDKNGQCVGLLRLHDIVKSGL